MPFEVFEKSSAPLAKVPTVTIQKRGIISLNRSAYALIDEPPAVEFLWDRDAEIIGLRPTEETNPNAYPLRPQSKSTAAPMVLAGSAFTKFHKIDTTEARRYVPTVDNGILCIDVSKPGQRVTSNRLGSSSSKSGDEQAI